MKIIALLICTMSFAESTLRNFKINEKARKKLESFDYAKTARGIYSDNLISVRRKMDLKVSLEELLSSLNKSGVSKSHKRDTLIDYFTFNHVKPKTKVKKSKIDTLLMKKRKYNQESNDFVDTARDVSVDRLWNSEKENFRKMIDLTQMIKDKKTSKDIKKLLEGLPILTKKEMQLLERYSAAPIDEKVKIVEEVRHTLDLLAAKVKEVKQKRIDLYAQKLQEKTQSNLFCADELERTGEVFSLLAEREENKPISMLKRILGKKRKRLSRSHWVERDYSVSIPCNSKDHVSTRYHKETYDMEGTKPELWISIEKANYQTSALTHLRKRDKGVLTKKSPLLKKFSAFDSEESKKSEDVKKTIKIFCDDMLAYSKRSLANRESTYKWRRKKLYKDLRSIERKK